MYNFTHDIGTIVHFGKGQIEKLPGAVKQYANKVLLTYGGGSVSIDDVNAYITKLVNDDGFLVTQQVKSDGTGQSYQIGKSSSSGGKILLIDFYFVDGGDTVITYTETSGQVTAA